MGHYLTRCTAQQDSDPPSAVQSPTRSKKEAPPSYRVSPKTENNKMFQHDETPKQANERTPSRRSSSSFSIDARIDAFYSRYKDKVDDKILAEGMERFCEDLRVDPTEFIVLVLAWKFSADEMCSFSRQEFVDGCRKLHAYSPETLRDTFPQLLVEAETHFKDLYRFTFNFGLDKQAGQRALPVSMAVPLWKLVFTSRTPEILEPWCTYLEENQIKGISRDTWNMFLPFSQIINSDFSNYDDREAWPSLFDDFVEHQTSQK
jgi:DCN1-like protein 3